MSFIDSFQEKIWRDKYQYNNETFDGFCNRVASNVFTDDAERQDQLHQIIAQFKALFGGRINSNIGIPEEGLTLFNCFIESIVENPDSLEGILDMVTKYAITLKTEGGVGFCANFLRPSKTLIKKIGVTTPGAIKFLEIFDKVSEVITSGSVSKDDSYQGIPTKKSIRKGATMVTMSINHPDIEEFITAKSTPNRLTKMNMSVLITDAFMEAVDRDWDWDLWFPNTSAKYYDTEWDGNFESWAEKGYPYVIYKTMKARELWELLLKNTYARNEPGILFIDNVRKMDNLHYITGSITATNPCGEVPGNTGIVKYKGKLYELGDVCNLGSINLAKFYNIKTGKFDHDGFLRTTDLMVRSLDRIIDISNYPLKMYEDAAKLKRKIGVGLMGVGSLLMMMNLRYGGPESLVVLEEILSNFMNQAYTTSALLAKEFGPFPLYDEKLLLGGYVKNSGVLTEETLHIIKVCGGLRNCAVAAIAPNGTLAIVAGNISGGLEPVFATEFTRWNRVEGKRMDFKYPNIHKGEWFETDYFKEQPVADEVVLLSKDGDYRIDKNNGLCKKVVIKDYGYALAETVGHTEVQTAKELSVDEHLNILRLFAKYIDQSCSKTINLPGDISFEEFKALYGKLNEFGIKGCTTYREGSSVGILETQKKEIAKSVKAQQKEFLASFKDQENGELITDNVKLPSEYPAKGFVLRSEGKKWYLHVAFKDKACTRPFALFVNTNNKEDNVITYDALEKLEDLARSKGLNGEYIDEVKRKSGYQKNPVKICRMLGLVLRHNIDVYEIVKALDELNGATVGTFVHRIKKFLAQFVTKIDDPILCPECNEKAIVFESGCYQCKNCGHTKC